VPSTVVLTQALSQVYAGLVLHVVDMFHARIREVAIVGYQLRQQRLDEILGTVSGLQPTGKHRNETVNTVAHHISLDKVAVNTLNTSRDHIRSDWNETADVIRDSFGPLKPISAAPSTSEPSNQSFVSASMLNRSRSAGTGIFLSHGVCHSMQRSPLISIVSLSKLMSKLIRLRTVLFVGDSLTRQMFDALLMHMQAANFNVTLTTITYRIPKDAKKCFEVVSEAEGHRRNGKKRVDECGGETCSAYRVHVAKVPELQIILKLLAVYRSRPRDRPNTVALHRPANGRDPVVPYFWNTCKFCHVEQLLSTSNFSIINFGLHFRHQRPWFQQLLADVRQIMHLNPTVHWRLTLPQHFQTDNGEYLYSNQSKSSGSCRKTSVPRHPSDLFEQNALLDASYPGPIPQRGGNGSLSRLGDQILDLYGIMASAGNLHSVGNVKDCTHFCWHDQLWEPVWERLTKAVEAIGHGHEERERER
jgi:hypothetical protein